VASWKILHLVQFHDFPSDRNIHLWLIFQQAMFDYQGVNLKKNKKKEPPNQTNYKSLPGGKSQSNQQCPFGKNRRAGLVYHLSSNKPVVKGVNKPLY
jgi:hypothetical protein